MKLPLKAVAMWLAFLVLAFANGALRQMATQPLLGEQAARLGHTLALAALFLLLARWFARAVGPAGLDGRCLLGLAWAVGASLFEIGLGRALGMPWERILADWNVAEGRLWPLVPLALLLGPVLAGGPASGPAPGEESPPAARPRGKRRARR